MKQSILLSIVIISLSFQACHKDFEFQDFDYKSYNRVVGPEGGMLNFYANYDNDSKNTIIASLDIPSGALDSLMVFNMYQFEDYELALQLENGFAKFGSKLLYFVPFYESEGYHERGTMELNYHLSTEFKQPVTVTYHPLADNSDLALKSWQEVELYSNFYKTTNNSYKVYRIRIPKTDQWGEDNNIFVNWTRQGYPNGYDRTNLSYIVNGRWSSSDRWGTGEISMENWQELPVTDYNVNTADDEVTFKITSTDYIYVVARDIYLKSIPTDIIDYVVTYLPTYQILRASFDDENYKVYFADNSVATFDRYKYFLSLINESLNYSNLPSAAQSFIKRYYSGYEIKKVISEQLYGNLQYDVILSSGLKLFFDFYGNFIGLSQYNIDPSKLPASAVDYLKKNHSGDLITNVTYDSLYYAKYIVYLSSNTKVYFLADGTWNETLSFKLNSDKLPANIHEYFSTNFPNAIFSNIEYTLWPGYSYYEIFLVDKKWFKFSGNGDLVQFTFRNLLENDLPDAVKKYVKANYSQIITDINHYYDNIEGQPYQYYEIYFSDNVIITIDPNNIPLGKK